MYSNLLISTWLFIPGGGFQKDTKVLHSMAQKWNIKQIMLPWLEIRQVCYWDVCASRFAEWWLHGFKFLRGHSELQKKNSLEIADDFQIKCISCYSNITIRVCVRFDHALEKRSINAGNCYNYYYSISAFSMHKINFSLKFSQCKIARQNRSLYIKRRRQKYTAG